MGEQFFWRTRFVARKIFWDLVHPGQVVNTLAARQNKAPIDSSFNDRLACRAVIEGRNLHEVSTLGSTVAEPRGFLTK